MTDAFPNESIRVRLDLAYDGAASHGWARQPGLRTVQGVLEEALSTLLRRPVPVTVAGRTDAGVHARGQVVHLDVTQREWAALPGRSERTPESSLLARMAGLLPPDIVVGRVEVVPAAFDARFAALWRRYSYRIHDGAAPDPLLRSWVVHHRRPLDELAMAQAAGTLVGEHDFLAFCKPRAGATTIRTLLGLSVARAGDIVTIEARADAFCHSMVRSLVGALMVVGEGRRAVAWPREVLDRRHRDGAVPLAPAPGLVLEEVGYPPSQGLAQRARQARAVRGPVHGPVQGARRGVGGAGCAPQEGQSSSS
ncbi:tRNA pseudouridine(38-40) synthase TruA [Serinibacter salmoneus]|uniref:tRNA pseudouridine synthase A n=1 Tax=Serinibacter salmoneus TaxID=556530 RepID=A0A2A9CXT7_9MICO|nr:tRNA pseudouridine(38-40) synthase TruA [Serinibacter salmoneus]PFG18961.1 tRNA pseudouridine38-40 synthase [Serinibacter salmoneus]